MIAKNTATNKTKQKTILIQFFIVIIFLTDEVTRGYLMLTIYARLLVRWRQLCFQLIDSIDTPFVTLRLETIKLFTEIN